MAGTEGVLQPGTLTVRVVQWQPGPDSAANLAYLGEAMASASADGVDLVVAPEYAQVHRVTPSPEWTARHEGLDGPFVSGLVALAGQHGVTVVAGMVETGPAGKPFNTQVAVDGTGVIAVNRKIHLYDAFSMVESDFFERAPEAEPELFVLRGLTIGVQTCYDLRFPEVTRRLVDAGAEVVLVPAQWVPGPGKTHQWLTLLTARAIEAQVWMVAADHPGPTGVGASAVISPRGEILAQADADPTALTAVIDRATVEEVRRINPMARARRFRVEWDQGH